MGVTNLKSSLRHRDCFDTFRHPKPVLLISLVERIQGLIGS